jgi:hypothetical protein
VATSASIDSTHTNLPMASTNISMVAKTVVPGTSPPSTTAGSTGDTVLNETAFDVSERRETVNRVGPETRQTRARIGGMTCDELVNLLENYGADGGFLESVLSCGTTGAEFKEMLASAGTAQEAVQLFASVTDMEPFKMMALWSRTRTEATDGQASGEEPRLPHIGPRATDLDDHAVEREENVLESRSMDSEEFRSRTRAGTYSRPSLGEEPRPMLTVQGSRMFPRSHADEREEDEPEGRSEYSDEYIIKCFGAHRGPKLDLSEEQCDRYGDWLAVKNAAVDWLMGHGKELAAAVGSVITNPNQVDPGMIVAGLSRKASIQDRVLGGHLYATASEYVKLKLIMDSSRHGPYGPSAVKIYHYLTYKLHRSTHKARTKLTEAMSDATDEGRWQPVKQPEKLEDEVEALDQAADEIRVMSGGLDAEAAGVWRSALDRLISGLESAPEYFAEFGFHVMTFKKDHPTFSGIQLREAIEEPMSILATNYRMREAEAKPGGIEPEEWIKPGEEEMEELEWLNSKIAKAMSPAGAMWLKND